MNNEIVDYWKKRLIECIFSKDRYMANAILTRIRQLTNNSDGSICVSVHSGYVFDPKKAITPNADASLKAWFNLKKKCEKFFPEGNWKLAACSDTAYVYIKTLNYEKKNVSQNVDGGGAGKAQHETVA